jgi:hypothetical protein
MTAVDPREEHVADFTPADNHTMVVTDSIDRKELTRLGFGTATARAAARAITVDSKYAGFTFGYNRPPVVAAAVDFLAAIRRAHEHEGVRQVYLASSAANAPAALLALARVPDLVDRAVLPLGAFEFSNVTTFADPNFLPGALKYGGTQGLLSLCDRAKIALLPETATRDQVLRMLTSPTIPHP